MTKIPRFSGAELQGIAQLLNTEGIPFDFDGVTVGASSLGATTEYFLVLNEEDFVDTCALLMDYYGIDNGTTEPFEGPCPACGTQVSNTLDCPECGLHFGFGTPDSIKEHPFYKFLENNALLPSEEVASGSSDQ